MKPQGRKFFKDNTGSKHHVKIKGKFVAWWTDVCTPSKAKEKREAKKQIEIDSSNH